MDSACPGLEPPLPLCPQIRRTPPSPWETGGFPHISRCKGASFCPRKVPHPRVPYQTVNWQRSVFVILFTFSYEGCSDGNLLWGLSKGLIKDFVGKSRSLAFFHAHGPIASLPHCESGNSTQCHYCGLSLVDADRSPRMSPLCQAPLLPCAKAVFLHANPLHKQSTTYG